MSDKAKKFTLIGVAMGAILLVSLTGSFLYQKWCTYQEAVLLVQGYEDKTFPNIYLNGHDMSNKTEAEISAVIENEISSFLAREIQIKIDDKTYDLTLQEFEPTFSNNAKDFANQMVQIGKDLSILEQATQIQEPLRYDFSLSYEVSDDAVKTFVADIEEELFVKRQEPQFRMVGYGKFEVTEGSPGYSVNGENLFQELKSQLQLMSHDAVQISMERTEELQQTDPNLLKSVNAKISSYSSSYDPTIARAQNVILGANKISNTLLMPGDQFSFQQKVSPVTAANGYVGATIFLNGAATDGIGGGICQISSTLYGTTLRAGIIPTERRNHSLPVGYVPAGEDATMAENYIDYKFVNTLDYPIYIYSYAKDGRVTIEFWSNQNALKGITYRPHSTSFAHGEGTAADTWLYGYDGNGNTVYEKYLHRSIYKPYKVAE